MFPRENFHYKKNIRIIGGIDLNADKFISEYQKKFVDRGYPENLQKNSPFYLTALAARKYQKYIELVHGDSAQAGENQSRNQAMTLLGGQNLR